MATIRQKGIGQWHVQIRKKGFPPQTETFRTEVEAKEWATTTEADMIRGIHVDRTDSQRETLKDLIELYRNEVTEKRQGEESRISENARLDRFLREEKALCSYAVAFLRPSHFNDYIKRRLTQTVSRGQEGGRGRYKPVKHQPTLRADGTPRANAAQPKALPKPLKTISPSTVKRELTLLKNIIGHSKSRLNLAVNPVNSEDVTTCRRRRAQHSPDGRADRCPSRRVLCGGESICRSARRSGFRVGIPARQPSSTAVE